MDTRGSGGRRKVIPIDPCPRCGGGVVQKSRTRLAAVGILILAGAGLGFRWPSLSVSALILVEASASFLVWASLGRGRWCRGHKGFDGT
jgi:hypothetical protein